MISGMGVREQECASTVNQLGQHSSPRASRAVSRRRGARSRRIGIRRPEERGSPPFYRPCALWTSRAPTLRTCSWTHTCTYIYTSTF